jgi:hypothetical protein
LQAQRWGHQKNYQGWASRAARKSNRRLRLSIGNHKSDPKAQPLAQRNAASTEIIADIN